MMKTLPSAPTAKSPRRWAEHCVRIKTVAVGQRDAKPVQHKRIGLFIGVSKYKHHPRVRNLSICHLDAQVMEKIMKEHGRLDGGTVLVDEQATRKAIEQAFAELRQKSKPGHEIFASSTLTLEQAYQHVRVEVPKYMQANFPGREQTPQLVPAEGGKKVNLR